MTVVGGSRNSPPFKELGGSLPCSLDRILSQLNPVYIFTKTSLNPVYTFTPFSLTL